MVASLTHPDRILVRVMACGSVDDGKSSLLGRLLFDAGLVPDDTIEAARRDSKDRNQGPEGLDFSLFFDGLEAEREQGITIDVAYRYFATSRAKFVLADAPGHAQYTGNMATAASRAQAALLVIDATGGVLEQTRRHMQVLAAFHVPRLAVVVNKMDLVDYDEVRFRAIEREISTAVAGAGFSSVVTLPASALRGDNVVHANARLGWYSGPTVMGWLDALRDNETSEGASRFLVQYVVRTAEQRVLKGPLVSGRLTVGDRMTVLPSGVATTIAAMTAFSEHDQGSAQEAIAGTTPGIILADDVDVGRGAVLCAHDDVVELTDQAQATLVWVGRDALVPGRSYSAKIGYAVASVTATDIKSVLDLDTGRGKPAKILSHNEIGTVNLAFDRKLPLDPYRRCRETGSFILIDRASKQTVGAGIVEHALRRGRNLQRQDFDVTRSERAKLLGHSSSIIWLTGLSGSGKSTIANAVSAGLHARGRLTMVIDGDNLRMGLNQDLGFTEADRVENIRRAAAVSRLIAEAGATVLVALISPYARDRDAARQAAGDIPFVEVFVDASLDTCEARDPKGFYKKARQNLIPNFTGVSAPYEAPENPDLRLDTSLLSVDEAAQQIIDLIMAAETSI